MWRTPVSGHSAKSRSRTPRLQRIGSRQRQTRLQECLLEGAVPRSSGLVATERTGWSIHASSALNPAESLVNRAALPAGTM